MVSCLLSEAQPTGVLFVYSKLGLLEAQPTGVLFEYSKLGLLEA